VLLERAAFRLLTSQEGLLDIAVEAGYSSHEAFTRAFSRAYGAAPSVWRTAPTRVQLDSPNGVHFHPPGGLRLPARTEVTSMDLLVKMVEHHVWLVGEIVDRAARLDDEALDRVGPTYLGHIREVSEQGRLDETFVDAICEPAEVFTYGGMVAHVLTFAAYRRTLAVQALDAAGIGDLGYGDPMRWVAEPA
jgi:hypothetical protein